MKRNNRKARGERRSHDRWAVAGRTAGGIASNLDASLVDISLGGVLIEHAHPVPPGMTSSLTLLLPRQVVEMDCLAVHQHAVSPEGGGGEVYQTGLAFLNPSDSASRLIGECVDSVKGEKKKFPILLGIILLVISLGAYMASPVSKAEMLSKMKPAKVEHIDGTELSYVTLSEKAMQRIDLKTDQVREQRVSRSASPRKVVPYSSLIYDPHGQTWVYTSPKHRTFIRHKVEVDYIEGDIVVLNDGPPTGTIVASVGVAELYGTEFEVGH